MSDWWNHTAWTKVRHNVVDGKVSPEVDALLREMYDPTIEQVQKLLDAPKPAKVALEQGWLTGPGRQTLTGDV